MDIKRIKRAKGFLFDLDGVFIQSDRLLPGALKTIQVLENKSIPTFYYLNHNFPNPFNPTTRINYNLPKETLVSVIIYDLLGKKVNTLIDKELQEPGTKTVQWHGKDQEGLSLSSGIYFYSLETKYFLQKKKMILIK